MAVRKINGRYYVDFRIDVPGKGRKRIRKISPDQTKMGTREYQRALELEHLSTCRATNKERGKNQKAVRYREHAVEFLKHYAARKNKYSELQTKESILRCHLLPAFGDLNVGDIGAKDIDKFASKKLDSGLKPKTVNNLLSVLRTSLTVAERWGLIDKVPGVEWCKVDTPDFDFLTFSETERVLSVVDPEWYPMLFVAVRSGLRLGELRALRWQDVDLVAGRLYVRRAVTRGVVDTPKSNRSRELPLSRQTVAVLKAHRHLRGELVFCKADGSRLTKNQCKWPLWRACKRAGLGRRIGWHVTRHTFASALVMKGVTLRVVQELLGHSDIRTTMRYAHLAPGISKDAVNKLDLVQFGHSLGIPDEIGA